MLNETFRANSLCLGAGGGGGGWGVGLVGGGEPTDVGEGCVREALPGSSM